MTFLSDAIDWEQWSALYDALFSICPRFLEESFDVHVRAVGGYPLDQLEDYFEDASESATKLDLDTVLGLWLEDIKAAICYEWDGALSEDQEERFIYAVGYRDRENLKAALRSAVPVLFDPTEVGHLGKM